MLEAQRGMYWECGGQIRHSFTLNEVFRSSLMWAGRAASAVLSRPGAVGRLLTIAAKSPDVDSFADALVAALGSTTLPTTASLDEMKLLLEQVPNLGLLLNYHPGVDPVPPPSKQHA